MRRAVLVSGVVGAVWLGAGALAQTVPVELYPYESRENYCPAGLQPITYDGVICCGVPNQSISYQAAMRHPRARGLRQRVRYDCPVGVKGCR